MPRPLVSILPKALCACVFALSATQARAVSPIQVSVDPSRSRNGEPVMLKVRVQLNDAANLAQPELKLGNDWSVLNSYTSRNPSVRIINGRITYQFRGEFTYLLKPRRAGRLKIPAVSIRAGNKNYSTEEIIVQVDRVSPNSGNSYAQRAPRRALPGMPGYTGRVPPSLPGFGGRGGFLDPDDEAQNNPPVPQRETFFVRAEASKTNVYQGEEIVLSYALYQRQQNLDSAEISKFPDFKGFLKEELVVPKTFSRTPVEVNGEVMYRSELFRYAVFPLKTGNLKIDPMVFKAEVVTSPADLLNSLMMGQMPDPNTDMGRIPVKKASQQLSIVSKPLPPEPAEAGQFTGAVGDFQLEVKGPTGKLQVDQPFTVSLTLAGSGNFKSIEEPVLGMPKSIENFQTKNHYEFREDGTGFKNFEYLLLPRQAGTLTIDGLKWAYFDPDRGQYRTLSSEPLTLSIEGSNAGSTPGKTNEPPRPAFLAWHGGQQDFVSVDRIQKPSILVSPLAWSLQGILYAFVALLFWRRRQDDERNAHYRQAPWDKTAALIKSKEEWDNAELALLVDQWARERVVGFLAQPQLYSEASSRDELIEGLRNRVGPEREKHIEALRRLWSDLDVLRFTGARSSRAKTKEQFNHAVSAVEALVKSRPSLKRNSEA